MLAGSDLEDLRQSGRAVRSRTVLDWLNETWNANRRYGSLAIPGNSFYAESTVRLVEECRSAILYSADGTCFRGGPSGFSEFAMTMFQVELTLPADAVLTSAKLNGVQLGDQHRSKWFGRDSIRGSRKARPGEAAELEIGYSG